MYKFLLFYTCPSFIVTQHSLPVENVPAIHDQTFVILLATLIPKHSKQTDKTIHDQTFPTLLTAVIPNTVKNPSLLAVPPSAARTSS
jgi:hypothetical protein